MDCIMKGLQQLLPLLAVPPASPGNVSAAVADLQHRAAAAAFDSASAQAAAHLGHLYTAVQCMASRSATAAEVQRAMAPLHGSMLQLNDYATQTVLQACSALQLKLGEGLDEVMEAVDSLQLTVDSFSRHLAALHRDMHADLEQIKGHLAHKCGMHAGIAASMDSRRILTVRRFITSAPPCSARPAGRR